MEIYIQSKSGKFNKTLMVSDSGLLTALLELRTRGGYTAEYKGEEIFVPFEEIQFIRKQKPPATLPKHKLKEEHPPYTFHLHKIAGPGEDPCPACGARIQSCPEGEYCSWTGCDYVA